ncbi:IPT/TIG domain-containing protein [Glaciihabitans sp. dw_435]|uniref:phage tail tube protein n=1 Tax=Glaciihabitans sp. dw_435 TaxID=2720081 RepID=UPI001BD6B90D|nr:IPT/TIG domain-containing protein [Glaciihabitans sp. dw_435]
MSVNTGALIVPGHGSIFQAPANTAMPAGGLSAFSLMGTPPANWENLGHTSKDNLFSFKRDGGAPTTLDTYLVDGVSVIYDAVHWSLNVNSVQLDANTLNLAFNGYFDTDGGYIIPASNNGISRALFVYLTDGTGALGFYIPNNTVTIGDALSIDSKKFVEAPLVATILAPSTTAIPVGPTGLPGIMKLYKTNLTGTAATITTILPASKGAGDIVSLVGTGFAQATAVSVGGSALPASAYTIVNDTLIYVTLPAGAAGSTPFIVTTPLGASAAKAYTRVV